MRRLKKSFDVLLIILVLGLGIHAYRTKRLMAPPALSQVDSSTAPPGTVRNEAVSEESSKVIPPRFFFQARPQSLREPTAERWKASDYSVASTKNFGIIAIKHRDGDPSYFALSELQPVRCHPNDAETIDCVRMPNGQLLTVNKELNERLPMIARYRGYAQVRQHALTTPASPTEEDQDLATQK